jgi:hypothetical protein
LFLEAVRQAKLAGTSFDSHSPVLRSRLHLIRWQLLGKGCGHEVQHRINLLDFGPLNRRPPPSLS